MSEPVMYRYSQLRYHCKECGIFHTIVLAPVHNAKKARWKCPECGDKLKVSQTCTGASVDPQYGTSFTHVLVVEHGSTVEIPTKYDGTNARRKGNVSFKY